MGLILIFLLIIFALISYSFGVYLGIQAKALSIYNPLSSGIFSFLRTWADYVLIITSIIAIALVVFAGYYIWVPENLMSTGDVIQSLIFLMTFSTLLYSVAIKDYAVSFRERPITKVEFNPDDPNNFHATIMRVGAEVPSENRSIGEEIATYYARLQIINDGKKSLENVEVTIEKVEGEPPLYRPVLTLNLHWAFSEGGNERVMRIPQGSSRTLDLFEIPEPGITKLFADELQQLQIPDSDRYEALVRGFRTCSIKPTSLSDIYSAGKYFFYLCVSADNSAPKFIKIGVEYNGNWDKSATLMRNNNFKMTLLRVSDKRSDIFGEPFMVEN